MSTRESYPAGVPCWVDTAQPDVAGAGGFYGELFGWDFAGPGAMPGDPPGEYYVARVGGRDVAGVGSQPAGAEVGWLTHVAVERADEAVRRAVEAGGTVMVAPFDAAPAGRMATLADPAGAIFAVWEAGLREGAQRVNEPSAWAMSMLHCSDAEAAVRFYGAVFGWQAEEFASGISVLRLPGYVGGEPLQPVPRDVVAAMAANGADAHWSVDFWVDDADRVAARAVELGGELVAGPQDIPGFRNAVIRDPQGAVLSVSQLMH